MKNLHPCNLKCECYYSTDVNVHGSSFPLIHQAHSCCAEDLSMSPRRRSTFHSSSCGNTDYIYARAPRRPAMKTPNLRMLLCVGVLFAAVCASPLSAESTHGAWLRSAPIEGRAQENYASLPAAIVRLGDSSVLTTAQAEMIRGVRGMLGKTLRAEKDLPREEAIVLGTFESLQAVVRSEERRVSVDLGGRRIIKKKRSSVRGV